MNKLLLAFALFFTGQAAIWFQTNGQFVWPWFKKNQVQFLPADVPKRFRIEGNKKDE